MTAWARVGETPDETEVRYGTPLDSHPGLYSNTMVRTYSRAGILVEATFFMSNSGKSIVGEITYSLPYPTGQSNELTKVVLLKLLDANAAGQRWDMQANRPDTQEYSRPGATATVAPDLLTITLDEYAAFAAAEKTRLIAEQLDRIESHIRDF